MAKLTSLQADKQIFDLGEPIIRTLGVRLGYEVYVYYPGIDAPKTPNKTQVYVSVERTELSKDPLGVEADSGYLTNAEVRYKIHATEKITDLPFCRVAAESLAQLFSRRRCGNMVIKSGRWEDTIESYGRRILTVVVSYEYES